MERRISHMNWKEVKDLRDEIDSIILPVGTIEAHGAGPLGTDSEIPRSMANDIAPFVNALILPTVYYGVTSTLLPYPGSIDITEEVLYNTVFNIALSLVKDNYRFLIILNGHGGNNSVLNRVKQAIYRETGMFVIIVHWWQFAYSITEEIYFRPGGHSGVDETAMMIHIAPDSVNPDNYNRSLHYRRDSSIDSVPVPGPIIDYDEKISEPDFSPEKAKQYYNRVVESVSSRIQSIIDQINTHFSL
ncbi:MAG: creatininase family protein [candidate division WOR-3 bacterium]|nr:creatininase family protein [candidate division WOR-3 bacterium]